MLREFKRPKESENFIDELNSYIIKMTKSLDEIAEGRADFQKVREFICSLIKEQDENGFWGLISDSNVDGDVRVHYWYEPTYIATTIMMVYYLDHKSDAEGIKNFTDTLQRGLDACTGRGINGHGYDNIRGRIYALQIFSKGKLLKFVKEYPGLDAKFTDMINDIMIWLKTSLELGDTKGPWGEDYKEDMKKTVKQLINIDDFDIFKYIVEC